MEEFVGVVSVKRPSAGVFTPDPTSQAVSHPVLRLREYANAVGVMEVSTPASEHCIGVFDNLGDGLPFRVVVEDRPQLVAKRRATL